MGAARERAQHAARVGVVFRLAEDLPIEHDGGVGGENDARIGGVALGDACRHRARLVASDAQDVIRGELAFTRGLVDGGDLHVEVQTQRAEDLAPAWRGGREHEAARAHPATPCRSSR